MTKPEQKPLIQKAIKAQFKAEVHLDDITIVTTQDRQIIYFRLHKCPVIFMAVISSYVLDNKEINKVVRILMKD